MDRYSGWVGWKWVLGLAGGGVVFGVLMAVFLPIWMVRWLGGDDFRRLASQQISQVLQTEGDLEPLTWSSFSVYSSGFSTRSQATGPWRWDVREIRTEISPRLLLDRILRFPEITISRLSLTPGAGPGLIPPEKPAPATGGKASGELFRDVQVGTVRIRSLRVDPGPATAGWGARGLDLSLQPGRPQTTFAIKGGEILTPLPWLGTVQLDSARGRHAPPTLFLTDLTVRSTDGGSLGLSGEYTPGPVPKAQGKASWKNWALPGGKIGVGLFEIPARISGDFVLQELRSGGLVGQGQVRLVGAKLEPGQGSQTILGLLGILTGDTRLQQGAPLTTAEARWSMQPGLYEVTQIVAEAPGLMRAVGQIRVSGQNLSGQIVLGLERSLGAKVHALTGGECFRQEEGNYLCETINLSGTLDRPQNDLQGKLSAALTRTAVRTGVDILQKATGNTDPSTPAGAAGQILKSIFGPPPGR